MTDATTNTAATAHQPSTPLTRFLRWMMTRHTGRPHATDGLHSAPSDHRPPHVRMEHALDTLERARLLQGGLR